MAKKKGGTYDAKSISMLEGLEPVRLRPGMYIGGTGKTGYHHLLWEVVDNSIDEAIEGHADRIDVTLHRDGTTATVDDNGRGIPVGNVPGLRKPALEIVMTKLHAGGKFDRGKTYTHSGGLHGVGISVVNALSSKTTVQVRRDGKLHEQSYSRGKPKAKMAKKGAVKGTGTKITFTPDTQIFGEKLVFDPKVIADRLEAKSYLHSGVKIVFRDETKKPVRVLSFRHENGISEYLAKLVKDRGKAPVPSDAEGWFLSKQTDDLKIELALQWTESTDDLIKSYVNGVPTPSGGTHDNGFRGGLAKAVRNYISTHKLAPKGVTLLSEDVREGLVAVLSIYVPDPQFQGQTKERLNNPEVTAQVDGAIRPSLEKWLNTNKNTAEAIVARVVLAARARAASRAASQAVSRKTAVSHRLNLPGKLADCSSTDPSVSELFIVEGDSAGGSAKQGRDRKTQAILPLRGKVLNTEQATLAKVMANKELSDLVSALGCGMGPKLDIKKLRYHKIFLLMDADADGHHIATLLLTFFYRHMKELITNRFIYLAQPPLYRIDIGKKTFWALDDLDKDRIMADEAKGNAKPSVTRFKGLGEMNPATLKQTTLDRSTRTTLRVSIPRGEELLTDQIISQLLGKDASARYRLISESAGEVDDLDV